MTRPFRVGILRAARTVNTPLKRTFLLLLLILFAFLFRRHPSQEKEQEQRPAPASLSRQFRQPVRNRLQPRQFRPTLDLVADECRIVRPFAGLDHASA